ncbi:MAG TPA: ABC transporter permease subunit [Patescibacteria group bacterium]|nr:ABC transporter permease subunit [Patescibacteria group bacterium]
MSTARRVLDYLLNPRARLNDLPPLSPLTAEANETEAPIGQRGRRGYWRALFNLPFVVGLLIVLGLFLVVLFGPIWAPSNPYIAGEHIQPHLDSDTGEWISPPLEPSEEFPLGTDEYGNDLFSMLLYGARNTLIAAAFIAMARVFIGLGLGAYAGWHEGKTPDKVIMGTIGIIAAVPILLSSMILIFALDIRRGLPVFIVALTIVGWTEIAQYIRGEFLIMRKMPFIEGALSVGASSREIGIRHILPNILPQLLVITFLEVAAVLLLFGELGFVGVFIGGGSHISIGDDLTGTQLVTLAEVPEWGAMLAAGYQWLRSKPHIVYPPALAFFIAIIGFNALGEGLRRFIETYHVNPNFLLSRRMLLVIGGLTFATIFIINNAGPAPWFAKVSQAFDTDSAYGHTESLAVMDGRGAGQEGGQQAAAYIAEKFRQYGLDPGWQQAEYLFTNETLLVRPTSQPELTLLDVVGEPLQSFSHQVDFGFVIEGHGGSGESEAPITFLSFDQDPEFYSWESFQGLDLRGRIVLLIQGNAPPDFANEALIRGAEGVLWVTGNELNAVRSQIQSGNPEHPSLQTPTIPIFRIRPAVSQAIMASTGESLSGLFSDRSSAEQRGLGWTSHNLDARMRMSLALDNPETTPVPVVLGYVNGSDFTISNELVVIFASYDGLGVDPNGTVFPAANHNAAGIGMMLEVARLWQEQELDPRRSVLFVAWGGGQLDDSGAQKFLADRTSFRHLPANNNGTPLAPRVVLQLDYLGAGGDTLLIHPQSSTDLRELWVETASDAGIPVTMMAEDTVPQVEVLKAQRSAWLSFAWEDSAVPPSEDLMEYIDAEKLQVIGQAFTRMLTEIVRQTRL